MMRKGRTRTDDVPLFYRLKPLSFPFKWTHSELKAKSSLLFFLLFFLSSFFRSLFFLLSCCVLKCACFLFHEGVLRTCDRVHFLHIFLGFFFFSFIYCVDFLRISSLGLSLSLEWPRCPSDTRNPDRLSWLLFTTMAGCLLPLSSQVASSLPPFHPIYILGRD